MKRSPSALFRNRSAARRLVLAFLAALMISQPGCLGLIANFMHAVKPGVPAQCEELEDSMVAIVTTTESSPYKDDIAAQILSKHLGSVLTQKVGDLKLVRQRQLRGDRH